MGADGPTTRCKFHCTSVENTEGGGVWVNFNVVYPQERDGFAHGEDHAFFAATPSGTMRLFITNPYGAELFQPGKDFYADISEAAKPEPGDAS